MDDMERELEQKFREAFALTSTEEDTVWQSFEGTLPERQGWLAFHMAMEATERYVRQALARTHYSQRDTLMRGAKR